MSYEVGIKKINERYVQVRKELYKVRDYYQDSIDILKNVQGIEECNDLKKQIKNKKDKLEEDIKKIENVETLLLSRARQKDREDAAKAAALAKAKQEAEEKARLEKETKQDVSGG